MKDIKNYEGIYAVTSCGKVWSYRSKKFLKPISDKDGYLKVNLYKDGKMRTFQVHRLVAEAYIPNPENLPEINHKDEVKYHDWVGNLEWCNHEYNLNYGTRNERASQSARGGVHKKGRKQVYCPELNETFWGGIEVERKYGIDQAEVSKCCHGKKKSAGKHPVTGEKLHWRFVDEVA